MEYQRRGKREWGWRNIWKDNGWEFSKIDKRCQATDTSSSTSCKQEKYKKQQKPYIDHSGTYTNQRQREKYQVQPEVGKKTFKRAAIRMTVLFSIKIMESRRYLWCDKKN